MEEVLVSKEKVIQKFFRVFASDCRVKVNILHDVGLDFKYFHVIVYIDGCLSLRVFHDFGKFMKKQFNLDCCELHFDFADSCLFLKCFSYE